MPVRVAQRVPNAHDRQSLLASSHSFPRRALAERALADNPIRRWLDAKANLRSVFGWCCSTPPRPIAATPCPLVDAVYSTLYMSVRTQVYLTEDQRARLNDRARQDGVGMAHVIRDAIDRFLSTEDDIEATFGAALDIKRRVPLRAEWDERG